MVYFWQKQHRTGQASTPATSATSRTSSSQSSTSTSSNLSTLGLGGGHPSHLQKNRSSSSSSSSGGGSGSSSHNTNMGNISQSSSNNSLSKSHQTPSSYMLDKLSEYSRRKQATDRRRVAERELDNLNLKIDKLLSKMGEADTDNQGRLKLDEECVVCLAAAATMQTFPCGHKVVCRKCLIKTIQVAVSQRCLPLRCVICRDRILRLHHTIHGQGTPTSLSTSLTPPLTLSSRSASSPLTPTSPTSLFSLITGAKSQYSSPRLLSPTSASVQALHSPTSCITSDTASKLSRLSPTPLEEDFVHYTPSDVEAFVSSHNDALNLHTHEPLRGNSPEDQLRHMAKHSGGHHSLFSSKRHEASSHGFMHPPSVKIHPEAACQPNAFLQSPVESNPVPMALSQASSSQKPTSASKFFAKLLPKTSRRKCSWFKHE